MRNSFVRFACACTLLAFFAQGFAQTQQAAEPDHGVMAGDIDRSVKPGDNFFKYSNGEWLNRTEIPADRGGLSVFSLLNDVAVKRTSGMIEEIAKSNPAPGTGNRKIADVYDSYMNESGIEAKGLTPLKPHLDEVNAIHNRKDLARFFGENLRADVDPLNNTNFHTANVFGVWVAPDFSESDHYTAYLLQGGIELPDREYYLSNSEHMKNLRTQYQAHVAAMLKLAGFSDADARAVRVVELEHAIAGKHWSLSDDQDVRKANNPWKQSDFALKAPGLEWKEFFRAAGLDKQANFIVWQPSAVAGESALIASTSLDTWKDLLAYHLIEQYAAVLPKAFADERFAFFGKVLSGTPQQTPRWQRAVNNVNVILGDEVGKAYAQRYFPPESKSQVQTMVANIIAAFHKRIEGLNWMNPSTKAEAQAKLDSLYVGIGYPETWEDYSGLEIKADDIFGNLWRRNVFEYKREISRLGKPVDRHEWCMTPQTVNAVNLPLQNALNFPAAILEPPFFDPQAPDAFNYGAIGSIIGHEISHTFDSEGSAFDAKGALRNWWTPADLEHFKASTGKLVAQYDSYHPFPDLSLNGSQTLAENIADLGGLAASYDAYRTTLAGKPAAEQEGFTGDQQFFLGYGQSRRGKSREAALRRQVATDPHSPSEYRTDMVRNIDAWYNAFEVQSGEQLYLAPPDRVTIW
jgi:endothelin-converting enzyme/putative endopeptidase